ncbi:MAG: helix-turn-helix domain-containing protein [Proteobacteria bacterium]|nr:helix-turn-helix domain-containing protein [Pseudomonadota bacterium]
MERAKVVLLSDEGVTGTEQGRRLGVDGQRTRRWRKRWAKAASAVDEAEAAGASDKDLEARIAAVLGDAPRSGTPPTFSPEQVARLIALACEPPADSGLPVTHWTPAELAVEAVKRGIVESISARHLDRLLKRG